MKKIYNRKVIESIHFLLTYVIPSITVPINESLREDEEYFGRHLKVAEKWDADPDVIEDIKFARDSIRRSTQSSSNR